MSDTQNETCKHGCLPNQCEHKDQALMQLRDLGLLYYYYVMGSVQTGLKLLFPDQITISKE